MFFIDVTCISGAIFWKLHHADPIIDLRLLKVRNFAISNIFYFVFGLFASTTTIPVALADLTKSAFAVNLHKSADDAKTYTACGDIK